jgi:hypothetical protein
MSIVLLGSTSGSCTLQEQAVAGTTTLTLPTFDGTVGLLVSGTSVASTSGTSIDFTSIPAGVRRITVMFSGVSLSGTSSYLIQLGDAGGIETTGYAGSSVAAGNASTSSGNTSTAGVLIATGSGANILVGSVRLNLLGSNVWVADGSYGFTNIAFAGSTGSTKTLSDTLTQVRITTVNGTDTFDAGSINILYE